MTFSIAARCRKTGMFGVAISSSSPAVAARCAHARAGAGAICSQNVTDPRLGTRGLNLLAEGATAEETLEILVNTGSHIEYRQVTVVDRLSGSAIHTYSRTTRRSSGKALLGSGTWCRLRISVATSTDRSSSGRRCAVPSS